MITAKINPADYETPQDCQRAFQVKVLQLTNAVPLLHKNLQGIAMDILEGMGEFFDDAIAHGGRDGDYELHQLARQVEKLKLMFAKYSVISSMSTRVAVRFATTLALKDVPGILNDLLALIARGVALLNPKKPRAVTPDAPAKASDDPGAYNTVLAKLLQKLKSDAKAKSIAQNYKGTGKQSHRRQLWVSFTSGAVIDLWLENDRIGLGGVVHNGPPGGTYQLPKSIKYNNDTPEQVYQEVAKELKAWANP